MDHMTVDVFYFVFSVRHNAHLVTDNEAQSSDLDIVGKLNLHPGSHNMVCESVV